MYRSVRQDNKDFTLADRTHNSTADYILVITTMTTTFMRPRYFGPIDFYTSTLSDIISTLSVNSQGYRARDTYDECTSLKASGYKPSPAQPTTLTTSPDRLRSTSCLLPILPSRV